MSKNPILLIETGFSAGTRTVTSRLVQEFNSRGTNYVLCSNTLALNYYNEHYNIPSSNLEDLLPFESLKCKVKHKLNSLTKALEPAQSMLRLRAEEIIRKHSARAIFLPWIIDPLLPRFPITTGGMIMDLAWHDDPSSFPENKASLDKRFADNLSKLDVIFPISDFTSKSLQDAFPSFSPRTVTVPHGADLRELRPEVESQSAHTPYFLYPASVRPNKRHALLLEAVDRSLKAGNVFDLVLTGPGTDRLSTAKAKNQLELSLAQQIEASPRLSQHVRALGMVPQKQLDAYYREALACVMPSAYEGFGLPLIEALSHGTFAICSGIEPFSEQINRYHAHQRVIQVKDSTVDSWSQALQCILSEPIAKEAASITHERMKNWTWSDALDAYMQHLGI